MDPLRVAAGAVTGLAVGMTGVGGGALMTPILLLAFGTAPLVAVGTDLWFAALTKLAVSGLHARAGLIDWPVVRWLWAGSLPATVATVAWMAGRPADAATVQVVRGAIGIAVCLSATSLLFRWRPDPDRMRTADDERAAVPGYGRREPGTTVAVPGAPSRERGATMAVGALLGVLVTLTSVGAGALGAVCLYHLHPRRLTPVRLVATDIAHAVPLALGAGIGHLAIGQVDLGLLRDLLAGSVPAAVVGAALSTRVPHAWLRRALGALLLVIGGLTLGNAIR